jgi:hypothetical protein
LLINFDPNTLSGMKKSEIPGKLLNIAKVAQVSQNVLHMKVYHALEVPLK